MFLPHVIRIESPVETQNTTTGIITTTWAHFATAYAHYRPASVREFMSASSERSRVIGAFKLRPVDGLTRSMRVNFGGRYFNIEGVQADPHMGTDYVTLPVSEIVTG